MSDLALLIGKFLIFAFLYKKVLVPNVGQFLRGLNVDYISYLSLGLSVMASLFIIGLFVTTFETADRGISLALGCIFMGVVRGFQLVRL